MPFEVVLDETTSDFPLPIDDDLEPNAATLAVLAEESGETVRALRPLYLRPPDARPQAQPLARR